MRRLVGLLCRATALLLVCAGMPALVSASRVGAATVPPTGELACPLSGGTITFAKPLTNTPSTKIVKATLKATGSNCDHSHVIGGKAPITDVAVKATLQLAPGAQCGARYFLATTKPSKMQVKWQGRNAANNLMTVGVNNATVATLDVPVAGQCNFNGPTSTHPKLPFANQTVTVEYGVVENAATQAACASPTGLKTLQLADFSGVSTP